MNLTPIRFVPGAPDQNRQAGFGIIESLLVLLVISAVAAGLSQYFLSSKDQVLYRKARLAFEEDMLRLMMITEENSVCEHLSFVGSARLQLTGGRGGVRLNSIDTLKFDGAPVLKVERQKRYEVKSIELMQESIVYASYPSRARGSIVVKVEFLDKNKVPIVFKDADGNPTDAPKTGRIDVILASDQTAGGVITSCYGAFSRKISCKDGNGTYNPEATPNCQF
jgi:hypothetical protein